MLHERPPDDRALPMHELDDFRRKSGFEQHFDEQMRGVRHVFGGLENHRISAQQCRKHLPSGDSERKIERRDETGDANRAPITHRPFVAQLRGHDATEQAPAFRRCIECGVDPLLYVPTRFGQYFAHLPSHRARDRLLPLDEQLSHAQQDLTADRGRCFGPLRESAFGGRNRAVEIFSSGTREPSDHVVRVGRIAILEMVTARWSDPLARNEVLERFSHRRVAQARDKTTCRSVRHSRREVTRCPSPIRDPR